MKPFSSIQRLIAGTVLITYLVTNSSSSYAQTPAVPAPPSPVQIQVPKEFGTVEGFHPGTNGKTLFYIQDAHDSLEAQEHIAKIIDHLVEHENVKAVLEEGYEGPVPTDSFFGFIKNPKIREKVSYFLLDKLRLGAAEYAHINRKKDFRLIGADDLKLHKQNIKTYGKAHKSQEKILRELNTIHTEIKTLANRYFPKELKDWMKLKEKYDAGELSLADYLKRMNSDLLSTETNPKTFLEKIDSLENNIAHQYLKNDRDYQIFQYHKDLSLLERLAEIKLTSEEYQLASHLLKEIKTQDLANFIAKESKKSLVLSRAWETKIQNAVSFYEIAHQRETAIEKALSGADSKASILVFGGFHKQSIESMLNRAGFSYYVITPKITAPDPTHQAYYKQLMSVGYHDFETPFIAASSEIRPGSQTLAVPGASAPAHADRPPQILLESFARTEIQELETAIAKNPDIDLSLLDRSLQTSRSETRILGDDGRQPAPRQRIYKFFDGYFDENGIAKTAGGRQMALANYHMALREFQAGLLGTKQINGRDVKITATHIFGSFADTKNEPRIGIIRPGVTLNQAIENEYGSDKKYPSDVDLLIQVEDTKGQQISLNAMAITAVLASLLDHVFEDYGVLIHLNDKPYGEGQVLPLEDFKFTSRSESRPENEKPYVETLRELNTPFYGYRAIENSGGINFTEAARFLEMYDRILKFADTRQEKLDLLLLGPGLRDETSPQVTELLALLNDRTVDFTIVGNRFREIALAANQFMYFDTAFEEMDLKAEKNPALKPLVGRLKSDLKAITSDSESNPGRLELNWDLIANKPHDFPGHFEQLNYGEEKLDVIVATVSIIYPLLDLSPEKRLALLIKIIRALKPGGKLFIDPETLQLLAGQNPNAFFTPEQLEISRGSVEKQLQTEIPGSSIALFGGTVEKTKVSDFVALFGGIVEITKPSRSEMRTLEQWLETWSEISGLGLRLDTGSHDISLFDPKGKRVAFVNYELSPEKDSLKILNMIINQSGYRKQRLTALIILGLLAEYPSVETIKFWKANFNGERVIKSLDSLDFFHPVPVHRVTLTLRAVNRNALNVLVQSPDALRNFILKNQPYPTQRSEMRWFSNDSPKSKIVGLLRNKQYPVIPTLITQFHEGNSDFFQTLDDLKVPFAEFKKIVIAGASLEEISLMAQRSPQAEILAVDISLYRLKTLEKELADQPNLRDRVRLINDDLSQLDREFFSDGSVDFTYASSLDSSAFGFDHYKDGKDALKRMAQEEIRITKSNGYISHLDVEIPDYGTGVKILRRIGPALVQKISRSETRSEQDVYRETAKLYAKFEPLDKLIRSWQAGLSLPLLFLFFWHNDEYQVPYRVHALVLIGLSLMAHFTGLLFNPRNLQTHGLFKIVQHPISFAKLFATAGIFILIPNIYSLGFFLVRFAVVVWRMYAEYYFLREEFGSEYVDYWERTPLLIPYTLWARPIWQKAVERWTAPSAQKETPPDNSRSETRQKQTVAANPSENYLESTADHPSLVPALLVLDRLGIHTMESHFGGPDHSFSRPVDQTDIVLVGLNDENRKIMANHGFILPEPLYNGKGLRAWDPAHHTNIGFKRNPKDSAAETKRIGQQWQKITSLLKSQINFVRFTDIVEVAKKSALMTGLSKQEEKMLRSLAKRLPSSTEFHVFHDLQEWRKENSHDLAAAHAYFRNGVPIIALLDFYAFPSYLAHESIHIFQGENPGVSKYTASKLIEDLDALFSRPHLKASQLAQAWRDWKEAVVKTGVYTEEDIPYEFTSFLYDALFALQFGETERQYTFENYQTLKPNQWDPRIGPFFLSLHQKDSAAKDMRLLMQIFIYALQSEKLGPSRRKIIRLLREYYLSLDPQLPLPKTLQSRSEMRSSNDKQGLALDRGSDLLEDENQEKRGSYAPIIKVFQITSSNIQKITSEYNIDDIIKSPRLQSTSEGHSGLVEHGTSVVLEHSCGPCMGMYAINTKTKQVVWAHADATDLQLIDLQLSKIRDLGWGKEETIILLGGHMQGGLYKTSVQRYGANWQYELNEIEKALNERELLISRAKKIGHVVTAFSRFSNVGMSLYYDTDKKIFLIDQSILSNIFWKAGIPLNQYKHALKRKIKKNVPSEARSEMREEKFSEEIENEIRDNFVRPIDVPLDSWQRLIREYDPPPIIGQPPLDLREVKAPGLMLERGREAAQTLQRLIWDPGDTVLDIGSGPQGGFAFITALMGADVTSFEKDPETVNALQQKYEKLKDAIQKAGGSWKVIQGDFSNPKDREKLQGKFQNIIATDLIYPEQDLKDAANLKTSSRPTTDAVQIQSILEGIAAVKTSESGFVLFSIPTNNTKVRKYYVRDLLGKIGSATKLKNAFDKRITVPFSLGVRYGALSIWLEDLSGSRSETREEKPNGFRYSLAELFGLTANIAMVLTIFLGLGKTRDYLDKKLFEVFDYRDAMLVNLLLPLGAAFTILLVNYLLEKAQKDYTRYWLPWKLSDDAFVKQFESFKKTYRRLDLILHPTSIALLSIQTGFALRHHLFYSVIGFSFFMLSAWIASKIYSSYTKPRVTQNLLLTDGPYRYTQNPMYLFTWLAYLSYAVFTPGVFSIAGSLLYSFLMAALIIKERHEVWDKVRNTPDAEKYLEYVRNTPVFFPFPFKTNSRSETRGQQFRVNRNAEESAYRMSHPFRHPWYYTIAMILEDRYHGNYQGLKGLELGWHAKTGNLYASLVENGASMMGVGYQSPEGPKEDISEFLAKDINQYDFIYAPGVLSITSQIARDFPQNTMEKLLKIYELILPRLKDDGVFIVANLKREMFPPPGEEPRSPSIEQLMGLGFDVDRLNTSRSPELVTLRLQKKSSAKRSETRILAPSTLTASEKYKALDGFLGEQNFRNNRINQDGTIYWRTFIAESRAILNELERKLGDLRSKNYLSFGAGTLNDSLAAAYLYGMNVTAVEKDPDRSQEAEKVHQAAQVQGILTQPLDFRASTDAFDVSWKDTDIVYFFYTQPAGEKAREIFEQKLAQKILTMKPGAVIALMFTGTQLEAEQDQYEILNALSSEPPLEIADYESGRYLKTYTVPSPENIPSVITVKASGARSETRDAVAEIKNPDEALKKMIVQESLLALAAGILSLLFNFYIYIPWSEEWLGASAIWQMSGSSALNILVTGYLSFRFHSRLIAMNPRLESSGKSSMQLHAAASFRTLLLNLAVNIPVFGDFIFGWLYVLFPINAGSALLKGLLHQGVLAPLVFDPMGFLLGKMVVGKKDYPEAMHMMRESLPRFTILAFMIWAPSLFVSLLYSDPLVGFVIRSISGFIWGQAYILAMYAHLLPEFKYLRTMKIFKALQSIYDHPLFGAFVLSSAYWLLTAAILKQIHFGASNPWLTAGAAGTSAVAWGMTIAKDKTLRLDNISRSEIRGVAISIPPSLRGKIEVAHPRIEKKFWNWTFIESKLNSIHATLKIEPVPLLQFFIIFPKIVSYNDDSLVRKWKLLAEMGVPEDSRLTALRPLLPYNTDMMEAVAQQAKNQKISLTPNELRRLQDHLNAAFERNQQRLPKQKAQSLSAYLRGLQPQRSAGGRPLDLEATRKQEVIRIAEAFVPSLLKRLVEKRSEVREASIHEQMIAPLIYPRYVLQAPENSLYKSELLFEAPVKKTPEDDKALKMFQAGMRHYQERAQGSVILQNHLKHLETSSVLAVDLPTAFYFRSHEITPSRVMQISMRRRAILFSKKFLENLNPRIRAHRAIVAYYLDLGQSLIDKYDDLTEYFDREQTNYGVVSSSLQHIYRSIDQSLNDDLLRTEGVLFRDVDPFDVQVAWAQLAMINRELRRQFQTEAKKYEPVLLKKLDLLREVLKDWTEEQGYSDSEIPAKAAIITRVLPLRDALPDEAPQYQALRALERMNRNFQKFAYYYDSVGEQETAQKYYTLALEVYKMSQKIDFGGIVPLKVQQELVYFLLRIGNLEQFKIEFESLKHAFYAPQSRRSDQASFQSHHLSAWMIQSAPDLLYKLQAFRPGADKIRTMFISHIESDLINTYFEALSSRLSSFVKDLTRVKGVESENTFLAPVRKTGDVFSFSWRLDRSKDKEIRVEVTAQRLLGDLDRKEWAGEFVFTLKQKEDSSWVAVSADNPFKISPEIHKKFAHVPMILLQLALRLAENSGASHFHLRLPYSQQTQYEIRIKTSSGKVRQNFDIPLQTQQPGRRWAQPHPLVQKPISNIVPRPTPERSEMRDALETNTLDLSLKTVFDEADALLKEPFTDQTGLGLAMLRLKLLNAMGILTENTRVFSVLTGADIFPAFYAKELWTMDNRYNKDEMILRWRDALETIPLRYRLGHGSPQKLFDKIYHAQASVESEDFLKFWTEAMRPGDVVLLRFPTHFYTWWQQKNGTSFPKTAKAFHLWLDYLLDHAPAGVYFVTEDFLTHSEKMLYRGISKDQAHSLVSYLKTRNDLENVAASLSLENKTRFDSIAEDRSTHLADMVKIHAELNYPIGGELGIFVKKPAEATSSQNVRSEMRNGQVNDTYKETKQTITHLVSYLSSLKSSNEAQERFRYQLHGGVGNSVIPARLTIENIEADSDRAERNKSALMRMLPHAIYNLDLAIRFLEEILQQGAGFQMSPELSKELESEIAKSSTSGVAGELKEYSEDLGRMTFLTAPQSKDWLTDIQAHLIETKRKLEENFGQLSARSEVRKDKQKTSFSGKGTIAIDAKDLSELTADQQDELFKSAASNRSELRYIVYGDRSLVPETSALTAFSKLQNVRWASTNSASEAIRRYAASDSMIVSLTQNTDSSEISKFGDIRSRMKFVRLGKQLGRISFARLYALNGGVWSGVTEKNGFVDPSATLLATITQKWLSNFVAAYSA